MENKKQIKLNLLKEVLFNYIKENFTEEEGRVPNFLRDESMEKILGSFGDGNIGLDIDEMKPYLENAFLMGIEYGQKRKKENKAIVMLTMEGGAIQNIEVNKRHTPADVYTIFVDEDDFQNDQDILLNKDGAEVQVLKNGNFNVKQADWNKLNYNEQD
jgi:hypothetical protein